MTDPRSGSQRSWESVLLRWLAYPANIAFAGAAAFLLALPLVTWLSALVAAGVALREWREEGEDRVFTRTFSAWRATWRRTLPFSVVASALVALFIVNLGFLTSRATPTAAIMAAAMFPVLLLAVAWVIHLPAAVGASAEGSRREWTVTTTYLLVRSPLRASAALVATLTCWALCSVLPTLIPFVGLSIPAYCGLVSSRPRTEQ